MQISSIQTDGGASEIMFNMSISTTAPPPPPPVGGLLKSGKLCTLSPYRVSSSTEKNLSNQILS